MPTLTIVIGGNGAGKSTWCRNHRDELPRDFYDADSIAAGLGDWNSSVKQREARELVDRAIQEHLKRGGSFGFESTYSGRSRPRLVETAKAAGYTVEAVFVGTRRPEINIYRVRSRAANNTASCPAAAVVEQIDPCQRVRCPYQVVLCSGPPPPDLCLGDVVPRSCTSRRGVYTRCVGQRRCGHRS